jgi:hypothetical protein
MNTKANILEVHARTGNSGGLKNGNLTKITVEFGDEMVHVITVARGIIGVSGPAARRLICENELIGSWDSEFLRGR